MRIWGVQPRVLDASQMGALRARLGEWATHVDDTSRLVEAHAPELFV